MAGQRAAGSKSKQMTTDKQDYNATKTIIKDAGLKYWRFLPFWGFFSKPLRFTLEIY